MSTISDYIPRHLLNQWRMSKGIPTEPRDDCSNENIFKGRHAENKPNHKSTQIFHLFNYAEASHVIGKGHKRILEWMSRTGISNIEVFCDERDNKCLLISGNPTAVNQLKREIRLWIIECIGFQ